MTCFVVKNELSAFVDEALEAPRATELQAHLAGCPSCTRELQEIQRVRGLLRSLPVRRAPADFLAKVRAKAERKSIWERLGGAVAPVLRLPRPAQAGLAFAASLVIAVTVFWQDDKRLSPFDLGAAPSHSKVSEVANVPAREQQAVRLQDAATADPAELAKRQEENATGGGGASVEMDALTAQPLDRPSADKGALARRDAATESVALVPAPTPAPAPAILPGGGSSAGSRGWGGQPATSATPTAIGGTSTMGRTGSGAGAVDANGPYKAPSEPGLYASSPASSSGADTRAAAAPAPAKPDAAKPAAVVAKQTTLSSRDSDDELREEPAYDTSAAFGQSEPIPASGDVAGAEGFLGAGSGSNEEKARAKDESAGKKEKRAAKAAPSAELEATEGERSLAAPAATPAPVVAAGSAVTLSAKFLSASASAPAEVAAAAKAVGGRVITPSSGTPPGLGKVGASTVVIVEVPASGVAAFEERLRAMGTLERGDLPSVAVRYRLEVIRQ